MLRFKTLTLITVLALVALITFSNDSEAQRGRRVNAAVLMLDHDGDGIPNGQDSDYIPGTTYGQPTFIDTDGDGVCDTYVGGGYGFVDANGDGINDNAGWGGGHRGGRGGYGSNFVDLDGDGINDNTGAGYASGGRGPRLNWVDADGNGICDYFETGTFTGTGQRRGVRRN